MAKVSLRIYDREIESMVDRGQLDEAIAHCRHILNTFPKNLETYRLLGKAYLEARRYNEAVDIFERLLMAVPDDFVAHVGMSIIRDEQNELDAAIWHMERAFEVQPSNAAIQGELQRLFGRRDGVEPPKIRLTRGALAHMYVQGELYPQAISEIKAVLEDDRERQDMQVLLARAYFHAGQKSEAAEMCSQLLRRYPYCFDANRVLVELLPETEQSESLQVARRRVNELDPYSTFATGSVFRTEDVADAAVNLERLEWDGQPVDLGPEWKDSLGLGREDESADDEEPDWLKAGLESGSFAPIPTAQPDSVSSRDDDIPEFLREAGWGKDTGTYQEGASAFDASEEVAEESELAEGDLPDWIKAMAPSGVDMEDSSSQESQGTIEEDLTQDDVPDWLQGLGDAQDSSSEEQPLEQGDLPDWLAAMKPEDSISQELQPQMDDDFVAESAADDEDRDLPDWLKSAKADAEKFAADGLPSDEAESETPQEIPQEPELETPEVAADALSDWQFKDEETADTLDSGSIDTGDLGTSADEQDDAIAWLEGLAAKHGAKPEELVTDPSERMETEPDWIQQIKAAGTSSTADEEPVSQKEPSAEAFEDLPDFLSDKLTEPIDETVEAASAADLGTSAEEQDDAIAWLESLAAKHGAKPEELVTDPEARKDTAPEWVQKAAESNIVAENPVEEAIPSEEIQESLPDWMEAAGEEDETLLPELEDTQPNKPVSRAADDETGVWLRDLEEQESRVVDEQEPAAESESVAMDTGDDVPDWLRGLESGYAASEADSAQEDGKQEVPDWLSELEGDVAKAEAVSSSEEGRDDEVPDWLLDIGGEPSDAESTPIAQAEESSEPKAESAPEEEEQELPDWVSGLETESPTEESLPVAPIADAEASEPEAGTSLEAETPEVPDWLSGVETEQPEDGILSVSSVEDETDSESDQEAELEAVGAMEESDEPDLTDWLGSIETDEADVRVEETVAEEKASDDLPSWLAGLDEQNAQEEQPEPPPVSADEDLPEWLRGIDEEEPVQTEPTSPADWQPADAPSTARDEPQKEETQPEPEQVMEEPSVQEPISESAEPLSEPKTEPAARPEHEPYREPATVHTGALSLARDPILSQAQLELTQGNVPNALKSYEKLIRKGKMLDEIIFDLREALYRFPVDVSILQTLGDAYMRSNRLQDALDAYTKAEELLR